MENPNIDHLIFKVNRRSKNEEGVSSGHGQFLVRIYEYIFLGVSFMKYNVNEIQYQCVI